VQEKRFTRAVDHHDFDEPSRFNDPENVIRSLFVLTKSHFSKWNSGTGLRGAIIKSLLAVGKKAPELSESLIIGDPAAHTRRQ